MSPEFREIEVEISAELSGMRLDAALARLLPDTSRTQVAAWIREGTITQGGEPCKASHTAQAGERLQVRMPVERVSADIEPESMPLAIVYSDDQCLVIDKPAGLVVHPGAGNLAHTLQNGLLAFDPALARVPRAGIVHRLDKNTSGLLLIARTDNAFAALTEQLAAREVRREYLAVCNGVMTGGGEIRQPIGRHRVDRVRMSVRSDGRPAVTHYRVIEKFRAHTLVRVRLETGRTHQIRVHLAHAKYPIVGDPEYGGRPLVPRGASATLLHTLQSFRRQALHAASLGFVSPHTHQSIDCNAPLPEDMQHLIDELRVDSKAHSGGFAHGLRSEQRI